MKEFTNSNLSYQDIRIIIFDFDGTLYYHNNIEKRYADYLKKVVLNLSYSPTIKANIDKEVYNNKYLIKNEDKISFSEICEEYFSVYRPDWEKYKITQFFEPAYKSTTTISNDILKSLSEKYKLIIVSNELKEHIYYKASKLGIDLSYFESIYSPSIKHYHTCLKSEIYRNIINNYLLDNSEFFVIGDTFHSDIEPILRLGGNGLLVDSTENTELYLKEKFL